MNQKIRYLLESWRDYKIPDLMVRDFNYGLLNSEKILVIAGPRRSGKTYMQFQLIKQLLNDIRRENILYINFEDERLYPLEGNELTDMLDLYYEIFNPKDKVYLFLDEIQSIPNWEKFVRRVHDSKMGIKFILTGSSSKLLSREISTSLAGRSISLNLFPFSFEEFLRYRNIKPVGYFSTSKPMIRREFSQFVNSGGFPEIIEETEKELVLQEYFNTIFFNDIVKRFNVGKTQLLEDFLKICVNNFSSLFSFSKMENYFKSIGYKTSKATLIEYMGYAREVFLLFTTEILSYKIKDRLQYPKKVYCIDTGIVNALNFKASDNVGRLYENIVYIELKRRGRAINYFRSPKHEVDFVVKNGNKIRELIQVCYDLSDTDTKKREIRALLAAMDEFKIDKGLVITDDRLGEEKIDHKLISYKPLWVWLLEQEK